MLLSYDMKVTGEAGVAAAFTNLEQRAVRHNATVAASAAKATRQAKRTTGGSGGRAAATHEVKWAKWVEKEQIRILKKTIAAKMAGAKEVLAAEIAGIKAADKARERSDREYNSRVKSRSRMFGAGGRAVGRGVRSVGRIAAGGLALGGIYGAGAVVAGSVRKQLSLGHGAAALTNQAFGIRGETRSRSDIFRQVKDTAVKYGGHVDGGAVAAMESMRLMQRSTGDLGSTIGMMPFLTEMSRASDTSIQNMGEAAGKMIQNIMATRGVGSEEAQRVTQDSFRTLYGQGQLGAIEFKELAERMSGLVSSTADFGGALQDILPQMGAIAQLSLAGAADNPEQAMTAISNFVAIISKKGRKVEKVLQKQGVEDWRIYDKNNQLRDPRTLLRQTLTATKGQPEFYQKLFTKRGVKAFKPFSKVYNLARGAKRDAVEAEGGKISEKELNAVGLAAADKLLMRATDVEQTKATIKGNADFQSGQEDATLSKAWEELTLKIGNELLPLMPGFIDALVQATPAIVKITEAVARFASDALENPGEAIGQALAVGIGLQLAAAGIPAVLAWGFKKMFMKAALPAAVSTATTVAGGLLSGGAPVAEGVLAGTLAGKLWKGAKKVPGALKGGLSGLVAAGLSPVATAGGAALGGTALGGLGLGLLAGDLLGRGGAFDKILDNGTGFKASEQEGGLWGALTRSLKFFTGTETVSGAAPEGGFLGERWRDLRHITGNETVVGQNQDGKYYDMNSGVERDDLNLKQERIAQEAAVLAKQSEIQAKDADTAHLNKSNVDVMREAVTEFDTAARIIVEVMREQRGGNGGSENPPTPNPLE